MSMDIKNLIMNPNQLNSLSDDQILQIFNNDQISLDDKVILLEQNAIRINELPMNIFMKCMEYVDVDLMISDYMNKINSMNYTDLISFIYNHLSDDECLLYILETPLFQKYLLEENQTNQKPKLQTFKLFCDIHVNNDSEEDLMIIGEQISNLCPWIKQDPENITRLINAYLTEIVEQMDELYINDDIMNECITMLNTVMKSHVRLNNKMIEFYISLRLNELELTPYCKKIIIDTANQEKYMGDYQQASGTLRIFPSYTEEVYKPVFEKENVTDQSFINYFLNLQLLKCISHEIGHIVIQKNLGDFRTDFSTKLKENPYINYWYKNGILHEIQGEQKYFEKHECYIEEKQADLFAIFDIDKVVNSYFKDAFTEKELQSITKISSEKFIELYTEETESGLKISSPVKTFDKFFKATLPKDLTEIFPYVSTEHLSIMDSILFGSDIPIDILNKIADIMYGNIVTTSIYEQIEPLIKKTEKSPFVPKQF